MIKLNDLNITAKEWEKIASWTETHKNTDTDAICSAVAYESISNMYNRNWLESFVYQAIDGVNKKACFYWNEEREFERIKIASRYQHKPKYFFYSDYDSPKTAPTTARLAALQWLAQQELKNES